MINERLNYDGKVIYDAWEVRTQVSDAETFDEAKQRILAVAETLHIQDLVFFRKGKGMRHNGNTRYHVWEVRTHEAAVALHLAVGNFITYSTFLKI